MVNLMILKNDITKNGINSSIIPKDEADKIVSSKTNGINDLEELSDVVIGKMIKSNNSGRCKDFVPCVVIAKKSESDMVFYCYDKHKKRDTIVFYNKYHKVFVGGIAFKNKIQKEYNNYTKSSKSFCHKITSMYHLSRHAQLFSILTNEVD